MVLPSIYEKQIIQEFLNRLEKLKFDSKPQWGKMNAPQMLAHLNVAYDLAFGKINPHYSFFAKFFFKLFIKRVVTNEKSYGRNSPTGAVFVISSEKDFEKEKNNLIANIKETQTKGPSYFEGKENPAFGILTALEWNNMLYKHLSHHFAQFGI